MYVFFLSLYIFILRIRHHFLYFYFYKISFRIIFLLFLKALAGYKRDWAIISFQKLRLLYWHKKLHQKISFIFGKPRNRITFVIQRHEAGDKRTSKCTSWISVVLLFVRLFYDNMCTSLSSSIFQFLSFFSVYDIYFLYFNIN